MVLEEEAGDDEQPHTEGQEESLSVTMRRMMTRWTKETTDVWGQAEEVEAAAAAVVFSAVDWRYDAVVGRTSCRRRAQKGEDEEHRGKGRGTRMTGRLEASDRAEVAQHGGRDGHDALRT